MENIQHSLNSQMQPRRVWRFLSPFMVRTAGFPFATLWILHFDQSVAALERILRIERECQAERDHLWHTIYEMIGGESEKARRTLLLSVRKRLHSGQTIREKDLFDLSQAGFNSLKVRLVALEKRWAELQSVMDEGRRVCELELYAKRKALKQLSASPDIQEAIFLSSPDMYLNALRSWVTSDTGLRNSKAREIEEKIVLYLQRFCAKNETVSFFGPTCYGHWDPDSPNAVSFSDESTKGLARRKVLFSHWGVTMLAEQISADSKIRRFLCPRINPVCSIRGNSVYFHFMDRHFEMTVQEMRVLALCDGYTQAGQIAEQIARETGCKGGGRILKNIEKLAQMRILLLKIEIPPNLFTPLEHLTGFLRSLPDTYEAKDEWLAILGQFDSLRNAFCRAGLDERPRILRQIEELFNSVISAEFAEGNKQERREVHSRENAAQRRHGSHYGDRALIFEECLSNLNEFTFGKPLQEVLIRDLELVLTLDAYRGVLQHRYLQQVGRCIYNEMLHAGETLTYSAFVQRICAAEENDPGKYTSQAGPNHRLAFDQLLVKRLFDVNDSRKVVSLSENLLPDDARDCIETYPWVGGIDIAICAETMEDINRGRYKIVIGEVQNFIGVWGYSSYFYPDRLRLEKEVAEMISKLVDPSTLSSIVLTHDSKIKGYEYPGYSIEFRARSTKEQRMIVPYADLTVVEHNGELVLASNNGTTLHRLYCGVSDSLEERIFSVPKLLHTPLVNGLHTPRIEVGKIVYQRECWYFEGARIVSELRGTDALALLANAARLRERHDLPERVFVKVKSETKPVMIDFANLFLVEILLKLASRSQQVVMSEMLPDEQGIWLYREQGARTAEFRLTVYRG